MNIYEILRNKPKLMVIAAQQHRVLARGLTTVFPEDDVVDVALLRQPLTARPNTRAVAGRDCST